MINVERTKTRIDQLLDKGRALLAAPYTTSNLGHISEWVDHARFEEWSLGCRTFLRDVFGEGMELGDFEKKASGMNDPRHVQKGVAILQAVKENLEFGTLGRLDEMISAGIYSDFLGMAGSLLAEERAELIDMAAFLIGAVLENGLRKIARDRVKVKESDNISGLNHKLADAKVYNDLCRRKIDTWSAIRSNADHGRFGQNSRSDVQSMLSGVRDFLQEFLGG